MATEKLIDASWLSDSKLVFDPQSDAGLQAVVLCAQMLDLPADAKQIAHLHGKTNGQFQQLDLLQIAKRIGLKAKVGQFNVERVDRLPQPCLLFDVTLAHFVVFSHTDENSITCINPLTHEQIRYSNTSLGKRLGKDVILLSKSHDLPTRNEAFGIRWFLPSITKHSARFKKIIAAALLLQLFALVTPLLFQNIIDKVLVSRGLQSLDVLALGLLALAVFEPLFTYFRGIIFSHLASCVNSELSSRLFRHLLHLPMSFFGKRQAGDIIARVRELDHVRNFLTGSALMMVLDLAFVGVFLIFMFSYAAQLAWIVVASLVIYLAIWSIIAPFLRARVTVAFEKGAENTAFLTETVTGIETIKSLAVGARFKQDWETKLARYLKASFRTDMLGNWGGSGIGLVQKIISAALLWFGVNLVMAGDITIGGLVAFNMLSGHVTMPILRLAQIWQDFQHTSVSLNRIGDILDSPVEASVSSGRSSIDNIRGQIELRKVTFRYSNDGKEVLRRLDLKIAPGEKVGITGLSGSGKSTITKLIQRLYVPQSGQVLVDGVDLALADTSILRRQMGVVLQESFLFNGTIKENIMLGVSGADEEAVERVAKMAGAHDFITQLSGGYDTQVGERGNALSGGQRQRIAIARALLADPSILIFDEATSALDYESETAIIKQLPEILDSRTSIMIAHRLNAMRLCDRIIVMDKGEIIEQGPHEDLLRQDGQYALLWKMQNA